MTAVGKPVVGVGVKVAVTAGVGVRVAVGGTVAVGVSVAVGVGVGGRVGVEVGRGVDVGASVDTTVGSVEGVVAVSKDGLPLHPLTKNSKIRTRQAVFLDRSNVAELVCISLFIPVGRHYTPPRWRALSYSRYSLVNRFRN
jgi:hypothetical protein